MTDFPTLSFTSTSEIPVLFLILEAVDLYGGASGVVWGHCIGSIPLSGVTIALFLKKKKEECFFPAFLVC